MTAQPRPLGGRYQVGELLGYGGMAEVHRGRDLRLGRDVAIKMLRTDLARDATFQMRFRREAQNAASLNHPAIVAVYDTGEERAPTGETLPYIVMEFVNGRTLKEVLAAEGPMMPRRALEITADICSALEFSHRHGIIHRDVKPGNVMLNQAGQVKVMDFGIARALASGATTMTQTSAVIGTAQYLSPEQARGEAVDARSDVYATGCVLYELLTGHPPFVGDNPVSVAYQHVREDPRPPSYSNRTVPPDVDAVVLKALAKNPLNRYQSAGEMRADLLRAASGRPVYATPLMPMEELPPTAPPTRVVPAVGAGGPRTGQMSRVGDPHRRKKTSAGVVAALSALGVLAVIALVTGLILYKQPDDKISVPGVIGMTQAEAEQQLRAKGLSVAGADPRFGTDCQQDKVLEQTPGPGAKVDQNASVKLVVCAGPKATKMLNVVGASKDTAERNLKNAGLVPVFKDVDNDKPKDTVVKTDPAAGAEVREGQQVTVEVSKGNLKKVPDLKGMTQAEAEAELKKAGFNRYVFKTRSPNSPSDAGKVMSQDPQPGVTRNPEEITVTVFVGEQQTDPSPSPSTTAKGG